MIQVHENVSFWLNGTSTISNKDKLYVFLRKNTEKDAKRNKDISAYSSSWLSGGGPRPIPSANFRDFG